MGPWTLISAAKLSREERSQLTQALLEREHASRSASERRDLRDQVVVVNLRVAHAIAGRYRDRGVALEDLQQAACEGLSKAVERFDVTRHHDLLSFAVPTIRGEVLRYFRDVAWSVRPPRRLQELQWRINRSSGELALELGREPTDAEVCARLGVDRREYDEALLAFGCLTPPSLDQPVGRDQLTLGDGLAELSDGAGPAEARALLAPLLRRLTVRDRRILYLRFFEDRTQQEIGDELGVPQMQVSRWLSGIFARLRDEIGSLHAA